MNLSSLPRELSELTDILNVPHQTMVTRRRRRSGAAVGTHTVTIKAMDPLAFDQFNLNA
jgi:hypothetical protein